MLIEQKINLTSITKQYRLYASVPCISECKKIMRKRSDERIESSLLVKFNHGDAVSYGIVTNVSERGMCIKSGVCLQPDSAALLLIPLKDEHLAVDAEVRWIKETEEFYDSMGVELLEPPERYLQIVANIRSVQSVANTSL